MCDGKKVQFQSVETKHRIACFLEGEEKKTDVCTKKVGSDSGPDTGREEREMEKIF